VGKVQHLGFLGFAGCGGEIFVIRGFATLTHAVDEVTFTNTSHATYTGAGEG